MKVLLHVLNVTEKLLLKDLPTGSPGQRIVGIATPPSLLAWISASFLSISLVKVTEMFCEKLT